MQLSQVRADSNDTRIVINNKNGILLVADAVSKNGNPETDFNHTARNILCMKGGGYTETEVGRLWSKCMVSRALIVENQLYSNDEICMGCRNCL